MLKVKGIYDGTKVVLVNSLPIPPNTPVEVVVTDEALDAEQGYWQRLMDLGLIKEVRGQSGEESSFEPVRVTGAPVSETIIRERR